MTKDVINAIEVVGWRAERSEEKRGGNNRNEYEGLHKMIRISLLDNTLFFHYHYLSRCAVLFLLCCSIHTLHLLTAIKKQKDLCTQLSCLSILIYFDLFWSTSKVKRDTAYCMCHSIGHPYSSTFMINSLKQRTTLCENENTENIKDQGAIDDDWGRLSSPTA